MKLLNAKKIFPALLLTAVAILISLFPAYSAGSDSQSGEETEFNAGKFVIDHVSDAYEWHITSFGDLHVSVPLPVILYSKTSGFHIFMSSKFHHGHDAYNGFMIAHEGTWEGKIVELDATGNIIGRPWDFSISKTVAGFMVAAVLLVFMLIWVAGKARKGAEKAPS